MQASEELSLRQSTMLTIAGESGENFEVGDLCRLI
jgi:hypothetical protein